MKHDRNGRHTVFGRLVRGQDVVDAIHQVDKMLLISWATLGLSILLALRRKPCGQQPRAMNLPAASSGVS